MQQAWMREALAEKLGRVLQERAGPVEGDTEGLAAEEPQEGSMKAFATPSTARVMEQWDAMTDQQRSEAQRDSVAAGPKLAWSKPEEFPGELGTTLTNDDRLRMVADRPTDGLYDDLPREAFVSDEAVVDVHVRWDVVLVWLGVLVVSVTMLALLVLGVMVVLHAAHVGWVNRSLGLAWDEVCRRASW